MDNIEPKSEDLDKIKTKVGIKDTEAGQCEICKKRKAETPVMYNGIVVDACSKCYNDVMEEEE